MKLNKILAFSIVLPLILFSGCNKDIKDTQYNGKKNYSGLAESLNVSVKSEQALGNIRDASITCDNEKVYVIGSEINNDEYSLKMLDFDTGKSVPINIGFDFFDISDGALSGDDLYLIYQDNMYENHLSLLDKSGNVANDQVLDDGVVQNISLSDDYCYCFRVDESYDESLSFILDVFDRTLQKVKTLDLGELLMLKDDEGVSGVVSDLNDNLYLEIVLLDENKTHVNDIRIVKLSQDLKELYRISELSGMVGDRYEIYSASEEKICIASYDDQNGVIYENIYAASNGELLSMHEKQVKADEWILESEDGDINYRIDDEWYSYHPVNGDDVHLSDLNNDMENYERVIFNEGYSVALLYRKKSASGFQIIICDETGNSYEKKQVESDFDLNVKVSGSCVCDNKLYAVCSEETEKSDKILIYDLKTDSVLWCDANEIGDDIYKITDIETDGHSIIFLAQYQSSEENNIYTRFVRCSPDDIYNVTDVSEYDKDECWDELVKAVDGGVYALKTYPDKAFMKISNSETFTDFEKKVSDNIGLYTVDGTSLYGYNMLKRTVSSKPLNLLLNSCAVLNNNIVCLATDFSTMKNKLLFITNSDESRKNIIRVLCPEIISPDISKAVETFNKSHDKDIIELNEVSNDRTNDVVTGTDSMDIMISTSSTQLEKYAINGTLCNLTDYVCKDSDLNAENFIVSDIYNDNVFYIYPEFSLSAYICDKNQADVQKLSSISELAAMIDKTDIPVVEKGKETEFFVNIIENNIDELVDYQNRSCDFSGDLFNDIVDLMDKQKNSHHGDNNLISHYNIESLDEFGSVISKSCMINYFNEKKSEAFIKPEYFVALCADSKNKEIAWNFIKSMLNDDYQNDTRVFPVKKSVYNNHHYIGKDQKVMDELFSVLSRSNTIRGLDPGLSSLINEQIDMYLNNILSREELKSSLNSKVSLYLNEKY